VEDAKELKVLEAAKTMFLRYGFKRVTMGDIADQVGLSRPALYLVFPNKEAIFKGVIERFSKQNVADIKDQLPRCTSLHERLRLVFEIATVRGFEMVQRTPGAEELMECTQGFAREAIDQAYDALADLLGSIIADAPQTDRKPLEKMPKVMVLAARSFKENAKDVDELRALLDDMIVMALRSVGAE